MRVLLFIAGISLLTAAAALAFPGDERRPAAATAVESSGGFELSNSHDGMPVFEVTDFAPGDAVEGGVEIANSGDGPGELVLEQVDLEQGADDLAASLDLAIEDLTEPSAPASVYAGPLAAMTTKAIGVLQPGETRSFSFTATFPDTAAPQNLLQGASLSVGYRWRMREPAAEPPPGPKPPTGGGAPGTAPGPEPIVPALDVTIKRLRIKPGAGKLLVRAGCDRPCRLLARGRATIRVDGKRRGARIHPARRAAYTTASRRLTLRLPGRLRKLQRANPGSRVRVRITVVGRTPEGFTARAAASRRR